ncbi:MAG: hypothetical protein ACQKBY_05785 [Verrucomicrobiales bacterium]
MISALLGLFAILPLRAENVCVVNLAEKEIGYVLTLDGKHFPVVLGPRQSSGDFSIKEEAILSCHGEPFTLKAEQNQLIVLPRHKEEAVAAFEGLPAGKDFARVQIINLSGGEIEVHGTGETKKVASHEAVLLGDFKRTPRLRIDGVPSAELELDSEERCVFAVFIYEIENQRRAFVQLRF